MRSYKKMMKQAEDERSVSESDLPSEIWMRIISRLPLRFICHVRCVSKNWYSMISDLFSANLFQVKSLPTNLIILGNKYGTRAHPRCNLFMAEFFVTRDCPSAGASTSLEFYDLSFEYEPVASSNGFVLLIAYRNVNPVTYCVSNPILGQYMKLPFPKDIKGRRYFGGFGFCLSSKLYKVIQFHYQEGKGTVVEIHTLGTYTWRDTQIVPPEHLDDHVRTQTHSSIGTYLNGALYWMVIKKEDVFIYCFNLKNERFTSISAPQIEASEDVKLLGATGGHLNISVKSCGVLDVFLMKDYECKSSWTKVLSISIPQMDRRFRERAIEVISYADGSDVITLGCYDSESLYFYLVPWNLKADSGNVVGVEKIRSRYCPFAYVPSFTSLSDAVTGDTYQLKFGYLSKKYRLSYGP